ncbi:hypothetical protein C8F01DRAFT_1136604 [Mycena amicta]|nr:hypothetical protein C8F01DRAFT_1136604 [Mycena amicta]
MDSLSYPPYAWSPRQPSPPPPPPRITLAGSLDPTTGIFYRTPEHPRLRTAQACEKCRTRKAKCSGEHPSCSRCLSRGLPCDYAKEGRVRGPNKSKRDQPATDSFNDKPSYARRRRTTVAGHAIEPLSTHLPLPLSLPRLDTSGFNLNKRLSLPPNLDTSALDRFYSPSAYGSEPPDSATTSSYTDSRRGSFDPPFGLESAAKDPLGSHSRFAPPHALDGGYSSAMDPVFPGTNAYTHGAYVPTDDSSSFVALNPLIRRSRPGSSRSLSGGSSTSSSSGRGSYDDGGESGPASAVSESFPLFAANPYPSSSSYPQSGFSSSNTSFSPHPSPPHMHLGTSSSTSTGTIRGGNDQRPYSASSSSDSYVRTHGRAYDIPHSAPARQFSFAPAPPLPPPDTMGMEMDSSSSSSSSASDFSYQGRGCRASGGGLRGWVDPMSFEGEQSSSRQAVMAAAMTGGQPTAIHMPTSDARAGGMQQRPSPSPWPLSLSSMTQLAMPMPMPIGMGLGMGLGMTVEDMEYNAESQASFGGGGGGGGGGVPMGRTLSADAITIGAGDANADVGVTSMGMGSSSSMGRARAATVSGAMAI